MGARWAWHGLCEKGHRFGNFSGGSDGECYECGSTLYAEVMCGDGMGADDCAEDCWPEAEAVLDVLMKKGKK